MLSPPTLDSLLHILLRPQVLAYFAYFGLFAPDTLRNTVLTAATYILIATALQKYLHQTLYGTDILTTTTVHYQTVYNLQLMSCVHIVLGIYYSVLCNLCPEFISHCCVFSFYVVLWTIMCCIKVLTKLHFIPVYTSYIERWQKPTWLDLWPGSIGPGNLQHELSFLRSMPFYSL